MDSRAKGRRGEMMVLGLVREWWRRYEPEAEFARTPLSGGWQGRGARGQSLRGEMRMGGDLMTTSRTFPYSVEVKNCAGWTLDRVLQARPSPVWGWWVQCQQAASEAKLVPMLWFRKAVARKPGKPGSPWLVMLPMDYAVEVPVQPPMMVWTLRELRGLDVGKLQPILFEHATVLGVSPERAAELGSRFATKRFVAGKAGP